ncbi:MAG: FISUMP domain-containing protein [Candidatus Gracilibacteria bacterium]|nr:FISUMP domain-containing protein [Candidatus Gracilibacteria bacterium]
MKKLISATLVVFTLFTTATTLALTPVPVKLKPKAQATFDKMYVSISKDTDTVKIQKLNAGLNKLVGKQAMYVTLDPSKEAVKTLILQKIEELNAKNPTTYAGCNKPDIAVGRMVFSACNVGSTIAGTGSESFGSYFTFGTGMTIENLDWKKYSAGWKSKWTEKDRGMCNVNYHIPTKEEFKELFSYDSCKLETGVSNKNQSCGSSIASKLLIPSAGYYYGKNGFKAVPYGIFWTSNENEKGSAWKFKINLNNADKDYGYSALSTDSKINGLSVRCIKD